MRKTSFVDTVVESVVRKRKKSKKERKMGYR